MATEDRPGYWAGAAVPLLGLGMLVSFGGSALGRFFRNTGGLAGPIGIGLIIVAAAAFILLMLFVMGWALRKGWKAADKP